MPLLDHFRPPIWNRASWEGMHGMWPATIVQELYKVLPEDFSAEPRVHLGSNFEIDICAYEGDEGRAPGVTAVNGPGVATVTWAPPDPTLALDADLTEQYAYEVLIFDQSRARQLVAAVEIVSPGNKDRPENRQASVAKCAALLQNRVCVSIVDLVTTRHFNVYCDLLELMGQADPAFADRPATYAVTCRGRKVHDKPRFETWAYPLIVGQSLPTLPVWLAEDLAVSLNLETSYEAACRALRIR